MGFRDLSFKRKLYFTYSALIVLVLLGFLFTLYVMQRFVFTIDVKALGERVRTGSEQQMAVWFQPPATPKILETKQADLAKWKEEHVERIGKLREMGSQVQTLDQNVFMYAFNKSADLPAAFEELAAGRRSYFDAMSTAEPAASRAEAALLAEGGEASPRLLKSALLVLSQWRSNVSDTTIAACASVVNDAKAAGLQGLQTSFQALHQELSNLRAGLAAWEASIASAQKAMNEAALSYEEVVIQGESVVHKILHLLEALELIGVLVLVVIIIILVQRMVNLESRPLRDAANVLVKMSEGDITQLEGYELVQHRKDEIGILFSSLARLRTQIANVLRSMQQAVQELRNSSGELDSASQTLLNNSTSQAAGLEEASSSLEHISANITHNSELASGAAQSMNKESEAVAILQQDGEQSVAAVRAIASRTDKVQSIASQTNILALNAAVEAARAGEYGRGFSVVASEVRKLAEMSAATANEITHYAKEALKNNENTSERIATISEEIKQSAQLASGGATASREMTESVSSIASAVQELSQMAQEGAATSELVTATADRLAEQAKHLEETLAYFRV